MRLTNLKVGLGIPLSWHYCHSDFFDSFTMMDKSGIECTMIRANAGPIDEMRNSIVARAKGIGCSHLLFLDTDMAFPQNTLKKLLTHDVDIVGGLCFKRWPPFSPTMFVGEDYNLTVLDDYEEGLIEVSATGTACLLIKMEVFDFIEKPYFSFYPVPKGYRNEGKPVGEDVGFCYRAREAGFKVYVDTTIKTEHMTLVGINENLYRLNKKMIEKCGAGFGFD